MWAVENVEEVPVAVGALGSVTKEIGQWRKPCLVGLAFRKACSNYSMKYMPTGCILSWLKNKRG